MGEYIHKDFNKEHVRSALEQHEPGIGNREVIDITTGINRLEAYANRRQNIIRRAGFLTMHREIPPFSKS